MRKYSDHVQSVPGAAPGIEHEEIADLPGGTGQVHIACIDYSPEQVLIQEINNLEEFWLDIARMDGGNAGSVLMAYRIPTPSKCWRPNTICIR